MKMHKETKLESYAFKLYGQKEDGMVAIFRSEQRFSFIIRSDSLQFSKRKTLFNI